jgi:glycosyltransferase involved in cell wall biosynthesis
MTEVAAPGPRIAFLCTHSFTLATLYKGLFPYLIGRGFQVDAIIGDREFVDFPAEHFGDFTLRVVPMTRTPSPLKDLVGLVAMIRLFSAQRYDVVHVSTPKASLLGAIAARLTGQGPVIFVYRRKVYELYQGPKRRFYEAVEWLICRLSAIVAPISRELAGDLVREVGCAPEKIRFFGQGSSNGIDAERFRLTDTLKQEAAALRAELGIAAEAPVMLFLGRVCSEKGVDHLPGLLDRVRAQVPGVQLIVAGPDDARDPGSPATLERFAGDPAIHRIGYVSRPEPLFALCDLFVFPSFFEGFGNVLLEAAAMGRPSVAFDVSGVREAVLHGQTGLLGPMGDEAAMAEGAIRLLTDDGYRTAMGAAGRARVEAGFAREAIWREIEAALRELAGRRSPRPSAAAPAPPAE